jgi:hypothetical protein
MKYLFTLTILALLTETAAFAQTALERLEKQIREQVKPAGDGANQQGTPAPMPAGQQPGVISPYVHPPVSKRPPPGYLGVVADDRQDRGRGVRITSIKAGSPAEKAGLRVQDLILAATGIRVRQLSELADILDLYSPGDSVDFDVLRDGQSQKIKVTLSRGPAAAVNAAAGQPAELVPLPPGEKIATPPGEPLPAGPELVKPSREKTPPPPAAHPLVTPDSPTLTDREKIDLMQKRINELERRIQELERMLPEEQKTK